MNEVECSLILDNFLRISINDKLIYVDCSESKHYFEERHQDKNIKYLLKCRIIALVSQTSSEYSFFKITKNAFLLLSNNELLKLIQINNYICQMFSKDELLEFL